MSAFASKGFNANAYLALRPTYNKSLLNWLLYYHRGQCTTALDVACGPGTFTTDLAQKFDRVVGIDPSSSMVESATEDAHARNIKNVEYMLGSGEKIPVESNYADMFTVMQGAHWFRISEFYNEAIRVLRPGGTLAMIGYGYPEITNLPASANGRDFARNLATDKSLLETYWDRGYTLIDDKYAPLLDALCKDGRFSDITYVEYPRSINDTAAAAVFPEPWIDSKTMSLDDFRSYLKTWSAYKAWKDVFPVEVDIIDSYFNEYQRTHSLQGNVLVTVEWPHFAIIARKALPGK
ncbi:trans-aconitate methyltransferase 1 [Coemansia interrupta]|uniref:Trans-aconitate methyltransferase 1 n=1 Tax=Coemansia interrupta TaxID=1126814 RepID=A0A9W8HTE7_9FUNG|nr:trans-aconitate methyltransferase 1 [Coemansia interrupta]